MTITTSGPASRDAQLPFHARVDWTSFSELAKDVGSAGLRDLAPGTLAHLRVKQDAFILAREEDFQQLAGLAADAARLQRMVATLAEGIEIAAQQQDPRLLAWVRGVARELIGAAPAPRRDFAAELLADIADDEPAPRSSRMTVAAHGG